jgi:soluble lytic murein transglycosylase-like protein
MDIKVPATQQSFYNTTQKQANIAAMKSIYAKYKTFIDQAAKLANVDKDIILAVLFIESAGNPNIVSPAGAVGLMQLMVNPDTTTDVLVMENLKQRLTEPEKAILRKQLGSRLDNGILKMKYRNHITSPEGTVTDAKGVKSASWVTKKDLLNPEFNILVGTIFLGLLIDESVEDGKLRLDKIIVRYNMGYGAKKKGTLLPENIDLAVKTLPTETVGYIKKFAGVNGTLDSLKTKI